MKPGNGPTRKQAEPTANKMPIRQLALRDARPLFQWIAMEKL
jgi:hypothetical protein